MKAPTVRIAAWPHWYRPNPYLRLLHEALAGHGIESVPDLPLDARVLVGHGIRFSHIHWAYPLWRDCGTLRGQVRGVFRLRRFLDQAHAAGIRIVWTVHNTLEHEHRGFADRIGHELLRRGSDLRIYHSEETRAQMEQPDAHGAALVMPHGNYDGVLPPAAPRTVTRAGLGIADDARMLLCFGQIRTYKGFDLAAAALEQAHAECHLVIAGRAVDAPPARRSAAQHVIARDVTDQELADLLHAADAVLLPYRSVTSSGALLLALTAGKGVVAADLPYFAGVLRDAPDAGVLHAPGDAGSLARAVEEFFRKDPAERGRSARRLADGYPWSRVVEPYVAWLRAPAPERSEVVHAHPEHQAHHQLPAH